MPFSSYSPFGVRCSVFGVQYSVFICLLFFYTSHLSAQADSAKLYYDEGLVKAQSGQLDRALELFDRSIALKNDEYVAWYNRGIVKGMLGRYEEELQDMEQTIRLSPGYKKAYLNRGMARRHLTNYTGAITDFTLALQLDTAYAEAYYDRGSVYELYGQMKEACADFERAKSLGLEKANIKVEHCRDAEYQRRPIHPIVSLKTVAGELQYGFTPKDPIKVGTGPDGNIENEHAYLDLLRDAKGRPVLYQHISSCCGYASAGAPHGIAMEDKYQIFFTNEAGEQKSADVYLSFYDYDEPMILHGFKTVGP